MIFQNIINMVKKTWLYLLLALVATLILRYYFGPEFVDLFGIVVFGGLTAAGLWGLITKKKFPEWVLFGFIVIGLGGVIVDFWSSVNVIKSFITGG